MEGIGKLNTGRVRNPEFVDQVAVLCKKEDPILVVRSEFSLHFFGGLFFLLFGEIFTYCFRFLKIN